MKRAAQAMAVVVMTVAVGCTTQLTPATPPPADVGSLQFYHTNSAAPLSQLLLESYRQQSENWSYSIETANHDSLMTRLQDSESRYLFSHHLNHEDLWAVPLAYDALALVVNPQNPISDLSRADVRRIYRGYLTNWQQVGGEDGAITLYSRERGSSLRYEFERLVMGQQQTSPNAQILPSTAAMIERIATDVNGIGYLPFSQLDERVHVVAIDGVRPTITTIGSSSYPLRLTIFLIGLREPDEHLGAFVGWVQSDGQALLGSRYAPLPR